MKRYFQYPQLILGIALNLGVFMGYGAILNTISLGPLIPAFFGGLFNTLFYDSIYAFQDLDADKKGNTYSSSQKFVNYPKIIMSVLSMLALS